MRPTRVLTVVGLAAVLALSACSSDGYGDDSSSTTESAAATDSSAETEAAAAVCGVLVSFDDTVAEKVNAASDEITASTDPGDARDLLLEATDEVQTAVDGLADDYAALDLSSEGDIGQLVADVSANADDIDPQLELIRSELDDGLEGEESMAILSATYIHFEKVQSLAQPEQGDYDDTTLVEALDTEPDCEHTVSR